MERKRKKETNKNSDDDMESSDSSDDDDDEDNEDKERLISSDLPSLQSRTGKWFSNPIFASKTSCWCC
jgi:hypothetical protein